jgi:RecA/RadA recombinase
VLFVDIERSFDPIWAERLGVNIHEMDDRGTPLFDVYIAENAESYLQAITEAIRGNAYGLIIIDTIAKLSPRSEQESKFDHTPQIGLQARMMSRFLRTNGADLSMSDTVVLALNQVREDLSSMYANKTSSGGHAFHHDAALRLQTYTIHEKWDGGNTKDRIDTMKIRWKMVKSKVCDFNQLMHDITLEHLTSGEYVIDIIEEVFQLAKADGVFHTNSGEVWTGRGNAVFRGTLLGNGEDNIRKAMQGDYDLFSQILSAVENGVRHGTMGIEQEDFIGYDDPDEPGGTEAAVA